MYYLFIIRDNFFKKHEDFLYDLLNKLKNMHKENYNYGISLYYSVCKLFDTRSLKHYLKSKYNLKQINNKFYLDKYNYLEIRKSCCLINSSRYLREILCIFYIYNKNIFICNFDTGEHFWIRDKFK